jgi:hypothetical protein
VPAQPRKSAQSKTIEVGGVDITLAEIKHAMIVLTDARAPHTP